MVYGFFDGLVVVVLDVRFNFWDKGGMFFKKFFKGYVLENCEYFMFYIVYVKFLFIFENKV